MIFHPFRIIKKTFLGVDIGVSSIKVVEISRWGGKIELRNYGHIASSAIYQTPYQGFGGGSNFMISSPDVSEIIRAILKEAGIKTKEAVFSIPDFSTFFTTFQLPPMSEEELPGAVRYEARRHIPVPVSDVVLDWFHIGGELGKKGNGVSILLVAVPKETISRYQEIAKASSLDLKFLEAEAFSLARSLVHKEKEPICLLDIGAQSTSVNIVDQGLLKISYSSDISGNDFTATISKSLSISPEEAEKLKKTQGLISDQTKEILLPLVNLIIIEIEKILKDFETIDKRVKKIVLAGGSALLPGLDQYFSSYFKRPVEIGNPFFGLVYPPLLEQKLKTLGPSFAIAVGAALRGFES